MKEEIWLPVKGFEGYYEISDLGNVRGVERRYTDSKGRNVVRKCKMLKKRISKQTGYPMVNLSKNGKEYSFNIHRLIADAFIPNPYNLPCINHIDEDRSNSVLSNLERCDYSYNNSYGTAVQRRKNTFRKNTDGKHKTIYQFDLKGNLIETHKCGVNQLEERLGYYIKDCLRGNSKTAHGFVFSYSEVFSYFEDLPKSHQKFVLKTDEQGNVIERYKSISEASRKNGFERHSIIRQIKDNSVAIVNGMRFIVEHKDVCHILRKGVINLEENSSGNSNSKGHIYQYSTAGEFISKFNSINEAISHLGYGVPANIRNNLNGKSNSAYGFIWRYGC